MAENTLNIKGQEREVVFKIEGMTCAACAARIEKVLSRKKGINSASVNLATEKADVVYQADEIRLFEIKEAVSKIGYKALDREEVSGSDEAEKKKDRELFRQKFKLILAAIFTIPCFI